MPTPDAWLGEMAKFVVYLGFTPQEYYSLTMKERNAIIDEWNKKNRKTR